MRQFYVFSCNNEMKKERQLFKEDVFVVGCYASFEQYRLQFGKANRSKLRVDLYKGLLDMVTGR